MKTGVLLINLGTPDQPTTAAVRRYLREFLMDGRVIDLPWLARAVLVNAIIVPFRASKSARAYRTIWTDQGSPLLVNSKGLQNKLAHRLGEGYAVVLAMRYGSPNIALAMSQLQDCTKIIVIPVFPQYASAANGSAIQACLNLISRQWNVPSIQLIHQFYNNPGFIKAYAEVIARHRQSDDFLLMSYHGLPERHIHKSHCKAACDLQSACPVVSDNNAFCYRAHCYETSRLLANALHLSHDQYAVSFQSRLGKTPWIKPYTDELLQKLIDKGVRHLSVVCPAFVSDCLETLEEVGIRLREQWLSLGGERFTLIPCLNDEAQWVDALAGMVKSEEF